MGLLGEIHAGVGVGVGLIPQVLPLVTIPSTGITQSLALQIQPSASEQGVVQLARLVLRPSGAVADTHAPSTHLGLLGLSEEQEIGLLQ